jgi:hypothetical protein
MAAGNCQLQGYSAGRHDFEARIAEPGPLPVAGSQIRQAG